MKFSALSALVLVCVFAPMAGAEDDNRVDVLRAADAYDHAQLTQDRAALERVIAPDYRLVHGSGRIGDREDFISSVVAPSTHITGVDIANRTYTALGRDAAIVGGEGLTRGTDSGAPFVEHFVFSDTFVRRNGQWVVVFTQVTMLPAPAPQPAAH